LGQSNAEQERPYPVAKSGKTERIRPEG
jgi:hypothetical protein